MESIIPLITWTNDDESYLSSAFDKTCAKVPFEFGIDHSNRARR